MADAVSDAGPLIHLDEILHLKLLTETFNHIFIPDHVVREISNSSVHTFIHQSPDAISTEKVPERSLFSTKETFSCFRLHLADLAVLAILCKTENAID